MLLCLCLAMPTATFSWDSDWFSPLNQYLKTHDNIQTIAVVYNPRTHPNLTVPARIQNARVILVPLQSTRRVAATFNQEALSQTKLDLVYLVDDFSRAVTNQATRKFLQRLQLKRDFDLLSNNPDHTLIKEDSAS